MKQARESVHSSGYNYKKGKTWSKLVDGSDTEAPSTPKHSEMDAEMWQQRMQVLREDIEALNRQISYKQKQLQNARDQQVVWSVWGDQQRNSEVNVQKRTLESELAAFCRKEKKFQWYQQKKWIYRNVTRHGNKASTQRPSSSGFNISDKSDFSLSSPLLFTISYSCASRSTSLEIVSDDNSGLQATVEQVVVFESVSALQPFGQGEIGEGSSQDFCSGLPAFQN